jgi:hypothetical protein
LFAAIDEVSAAARSARLYLEGQVKARKQEIKGEIVQSGIRKVRALIEKQSDNFQSLTHYSRECTDRGLFEDAIKGKRGIEGMEAAVQLLIDRLGQEITERATAVAGHARKIAAIAPEHLPLFQDRSALLDRSDEDLDATIAERIQVFKQQQSAIAAVEPETEGIDALTITPPPGAEDGDLFPDKGSATEARDQPLLPFRITLNVAAKKHQAEALMERIRNDYASNPLVESIGMESGY